MSARCHAAARQAPAKGASTRAATRSPTAVLRRCACGGKAEKGGECAECRKKRLQRRGTGPGPAVAPASVHAVLATPGEPLAAGVRARLEPRLGHDLAAVRVHTDARAAGAARDVRALAWTVGSHVAFGAGQFDPGTTAGDRLLLHELAHTLQDGGGPVPRDLPVGGVDDAAEREADRIAEGIVTQAVAPPPAGRVLRRRLDPVLEAELPESARHQTMAVLSISEGPPPVQMDVVRRFERCPCRDVPEARDGTFYDVGRQRVAIAYRYCEGRTTTDVYAEAEGDPQRVLSGQVPITGARIGVEVNVAPRRDRGGRIILEAVGERPDEQTSVGAHVLLVYEQSGWHIFADADYRRRLGELNAGQVPDDVNVSLGGQWGRVRARVQLTDLAGPTPGVRVEGCLDIGITPQLCGFGQVGGESGSGGGIGLRVPFGVPERPRRERCFQCFCPPAKPVYECSRYTFPGFEQQPIEIQQSHEYRYYFYLDRADRQSEESDLRTQSNANLDAVERAVTDRQARVLDIVGYASPEATERHNETLSEARGQELHDRLERRLGGGVSLPPARGAGELLGNRPAPTPSSRLGDIITEHGFRDAEDLSFLLLGEEIPNRELTTQFLSLFDALPDAADRLALFGLSDSDPVAPRVLATVETFIRSRGRGSPRPWERIFRLLRVGVARVAWTEPGTVEVPVGSKHEPVTGAECERYARQAEDEHRFPPIDPQDLVPHVSAHDRNDECRFEPDAADRRRCDYAVPPSLRRNVPATAPSRAPHRF